jgi:hypothetical protein
MKSNEMKNQIKWSENKNCKWNENQITNEIERKIETRSKWNQKRNQI